jgi:carboxyl-terminal processing protease
MNIDPETNLYDILGVTKEAAPEEIAKNAEQKTDEYNKIAQDESQSEEARKEAEQKLALVDRAKETLTEPEKKENYDKEGVEATVISELVRPDIFYIKIKQLSPLTLEEFQKAVDKINQEADDNLDNLILDLRGNIGGSVDILPNFLGPFFGKNQYVYDWYQKGQYTPFRTATDALPSLARYKRMVVLTDGGTQSSAEVMTASFKRFNKGFVVGTRTKGWGTIERVFDLKNQIDANETYSVFLVHHITLRDDNQPIEGRGIDPLVSTDDNDWTTKVNSYYNYKTLSAAVGEVW